MPILMAFITNLTQAQPTTGSYNADGNPNGIANNAGTICMGGTQSGAITGVEYGSGNWNYGVVGGHEVVTVASGANGVTGCNPGTTFNYNNTTGIISMVTSGIAGLPFSGLNGSNSANVSVEGCTHWTKSPLFKHAVLSGWWSEYRGQFSFMTDETETTPSGGLWNISAGDAIAGCSGQNQDSQNEPGEVIYSLGSTPVQTGYGPRHNW